MMARSTCSGEGQNSYSPNILGVDLLKQRFDAACADGCTSGLYLCKSSDLTMVTSFRSTQASVTCGRSTNE
jgi:hypothetical protein